jgi:two-component system, NarL family, response regulator LiaR
MSMHERIRILIVDDHSLIREGLRAVLETQPDMELVGEARDGVEGVSRARTLRPDVVLMDMNLPRMDGVEATRQIVQNDPAVRVLVLSNYMDDDKVLGVLKAGAKGYLMKDTASHELRQAVRDVYQGKAALDPAIQRKLVDQVAHPHSKASGLVEELTSREREVLRLMTEGLTNHQIAVKLSLAEGTARFHVSNVLRKLGFPNRTQAVLYALQNGLVPPEKD